MSWYVRLVCTILYKVLLYLEVFVYFALYCTRCFNGMLCSYIVCAYTLYEDNMPLKHQVQYRGKYTNTSRYGSTLYKIVHTIRTTQDIKVPCKRLYILYEHIMTLKYLIQDCTYCTNTSRHWSTLYKIEHTEVRHTVRTVKNIEACYTIWDTRYKLST